MSLPAVVLVPFAAALLALAVRPNGLRRVLFIAAALAHAGLTASFWFASPAPAWDGFLELDALGLLFLTMVSLLFAAGSFYAAGYLSHEQAGVRQDFQGGVDFRNAPEARFTACLLLFLSAMTLVCSTRHFGLLWAAVEATTIASAPLIYFHRHRRSLEATWKYLIICSVGIALALMGNTLLAASAGQSGFADAPLSVDGLARLGPALNTAWLKTAFVFLLVGYGAKMGLAPMHTWLPDAHSESPSLVSALLSGALLNCAFLGVLRSFEVMAAAGQAAFAQQLLLAFGLVSMGTAAVFIVGQGDFKRLLAYSSVEHMGILAVAVGVGGGALFGGMLHLVNHSLTKAMLFFLAGNILGLYRTKSVHDIHGAVHSLPLTGPLWIVGFLAIVGSPPFGIFVSELTILKAAFETGHTAAALAFLVFLAVIFVGMAQAFLRMGFGEPTPYIRGQEVRENALLVAPPMVLGLCVLTLGLYLPRPAWLLMAQAAQTLIR